MAEVVDSHCGFVVKNIGDSLLFYFPDFADVDTNEKFVNCLTCGLEMVEMNDAINQLFKKEKLVPLNYRISADYGEVSIMKTNFSPNIDLFGGPVNMCAKINLLAKQNSMVIGQDLYTVVQNSDFFSFELAGSYSINPKFSYPVYSVWRKDHP
jgi:class 3 adenylate cyclase